MPLVTRLTRSSQVSDDDLELTYLPAWKALVEADAVGGIMSAISGLDGTPSVENKRMLTDVLRGGAISTVQLQPLLSPLSAEWGFEGFVISDCDTLPAVELQFRYTAGLQQSVARSVRAGNDLNCGPQFADLLNATISGFIDDNMLDVSVRRLLKRRIQVAVLPSTVQHPPSRYSTVPLVYSTPRIQ